MKLARAPCTAITSPWRTRALGDKKKKAREEFPGIVAANRDSTEAREVGTFWAAGKRLPVGRPGCWTDTGGPASATGRPGD